MSLEYPKIETLFYRNPSTFKVSLYNWRCPEFKYLQADNWLFTEKVDGTNTRVTFNGLEKSVEYAGRTFSADIPQTLLNRLQNLFPVERFLSDFPTWQDTIVTLYGEGYGAKIQSGGDNYKSDGVDFVLFDVNVRGLWLERVNIEDIAHKLNILDVPVVGQGTLKEAASFCEKGFTSAWGNFQAEGLVVRTPITLFNRKGERVIGKIKFKDF